MEIKSIFDAEFSPYGQVHKGYKLDGLLAAMKAMGSGSGNPALVQEEIFIKDLVETYQIPVEDARDFAFGGCSEILIPGKTNVDSTWCAYNTAEILHETIYRELEACESYEEFIARFKEQTAMTVDEMVRHVNIRQHLAGTFWLIPSCRCIRWDVWSREKGIGKAALSIILTVRIFSGILMLLILW